MGFCPSAVILPCLAGWVFKGNEMANVTTRSTALILLLLLPTITVSGQQTADQKKRVPVMSSDDLDAVPSVRQPVVGSGTSGRSPGLIRYLLESCGLSIELPAEPLSSEIPLPGRDRKTFGPVKSHMSVGDGYVIAACHFQSGGQLSLEGQIDEFVRGFFQGFSSD